MSPPFYFKSAHDKYVAITEDGTVIANREEIEEDGGETNLGIVLDGVGTTSIQSTMYEKYISANYNGSITFEADNDDSRGPWEKFSIRLGPIGFYLQSCHGKFLSAQDDDSMVWDRTEVGPWECFEGNVPIMLMTSPGNYVCAESNGKLAFNRNAVGPWETWYCCIEDKGQKVTLKSHHGKYLCVEPNGRMRANRDSAPAGGWECFSIVKHDAEGAGDNDFVFQTHHGTILSSNNGEPILCGNASFLSSILSKYYLKSVHGKYIAIQEDGSVVADRDDIVDGDTETSLGISMDILGSTSIQSISNGKYISAQNDGTLICDRDTGDGPWEKIHIRLGPTGFCFQSCHGKYLSAQDDECTMMWDRDTVGSWECFEGIIPVALFASPGCLVTSEKNGHLKFNRHSISSWETWYCCVEEQGQKVTLQNYHGKYLCCNESGEIWANRDDVGPWETFSIVENENDIGNYVLQTAHGTILTATDGSFDPLSVGNPDLVVSCLEANATSALSYVGLAAFHSLSKDHGQYRHQLWNITTGKVVDEVQQTPRDAFPSTEDPPEGHDDWFVDKMYDIICKTTKWCDVLSLSPPDGLFMTKFQEAFAVVNETAKGLDDGNKIIIRCLFGNLPGTPVNCNTLVEKLTENIGEDDISDNLELWVGAWRDGVSWNHAKIIAIDGCYLITGGHNLWDPHYLKSDPVHDLSFELCGNVAIDAHKFANQQWIFIEKHQKGTWVGNLVANALPDCLPTVLPTRVTVTEYPTGKADTFPPPFLRNNDIATQEEEEEEEDAFVPMVTMGRYGSMLGQPNRPSDDAIIAMIDSAQSIIRLALQDLGPPCLPGSQIAIPGCVWPKAYLSALGRAIWSRGVDVEILLSNPGSRPHNLPVTQANYGNGWNCVDVAAELIKTICEQFPDTATIDSDELRQKVTDNLRVCFIRHAHGTQYIESGMTIGMHAKHFIIDDISTYIGSQNLYICDLAEWGVVVDHPDSVNKIMDEYWKPMWEVSYTGEDCNVQDVIDGLEIDRNGADASELSEEDKRLMHQLMAGGQTNIDGIYDEE